MKDRFTRCPLCGATVLLKELNTFNGYCEVCHLLLQSLKGSKLKTDANLRGQRKEE